MKKMNLVIWVGVLFIGVLARAHDPSIPVGTTASYKTAARVVIFGHKKTSNSTITREVTALLPNDLYKIKETKVTGFKVEVSESSNDLNGLLSLDRDEAVSIDQIFKKCGATPDWQIVPVKVGRKKFQGCQILTTSGDVVLKRVYVREVPLFMALYEYSEKKDGNEIYVLMKYRD